MQPAIEYRSGRHCVYQLHAHLVFTPKYRRKVFTRAYLDAMRDIMAKVCGDYDATLVEFNGENDHVHLLVTYPPVMSLSKLINSLKSVSSRKLRSRFPELATHCRHGALWSRSYFVSSCGGAPLEYLKQYVEQQQTPD